MTRRPTRQRETLDLDRLRALFDQQRLDAGERVRLRRKELGLPMHKIADAVGVTMQTISKIERGEILPRDYLKAAIALTLAVEVDALWPYPTRLLLAQTAA